VAIERRAPASGDTDAPALVPSTWQLIRRTEAGPQVLADGILAFDLAPDGTILCSNGRSVRRLQTEGKGAERVTVGNMIAQVAAL